MTFYVSWVPELIRFFSELFKCLFCFQKCHWNDLIIYEKGMNLLLLARFVQSKVYPIHAAVWLSKSLSAWEAQSNECAFLNGGWCSRTVSFIWHIVHFFQLWHKYNFLPSFQRHVPVLVAPTLTIVIIWSKTNNQMSWLSNYGIFISLLYFLVTNIHPCSKTWSQSGCQISVRKIHNQSWENAQYWEIPMISFEISGFPTRSGLLIGGSVVVPK